MNLQELQAQLAKIEKEIELVKALERLQKCRLNARNSHKYFDLQQAYVDATKAK